MNVPYFNLKEHIRTSVGNDFIFDQAARPTVICELWTAGYSAAEIAWRLKITKQNVYVTLNRYDVERPRRAGEAISEGMKTNWTLRKNLEAMWARHEREAA
jgi:hypothetical protein